MKQLQKVDSHPMNEEKSSNPTMGSVGEGLCGNCLNAREIKSDKGSVFILCELSAKDPAFPKYPRLPVLVCVGYARKA